jgi:hypothetical protein
MKKIIIFFLTLFAGVALKAETVFTFTSSEDISQSKDGFSIELAQGANKSNGPVFQNPFYAGENHPEMRLYLDNTITVFGTSLTNIQMVFAKSNASGKAYAGLSASTGTLVSGGESESSEDWKVDSWTGSATNVVFTLTDKGQRQIQRIVINGAPIVITPQDQPLPTESDLVKNYIYSEPTVVGVKDTTILKKEYAFIDNNILVHSTLGSILKESTVEGDEHPAYFNVNEMEQLTFTATQAIQAIEIDGYLRKDFSASSDKGTLTSKSNPDWEVEEEKVVVVSGINSPSVTLNCVKQVRCYAVRVFFKQYIAGVEDIQPASRTTYKKLHNGQIIIVRENRQYTLLGTEL